MAPGEEEAQLVSYRLGALEKRVDSHAAHVDARLDRIDSQLTALTAMAQMEKRLDARIDFLTAGVEKELAGLGKDASRNWAAFLWVMGILFGLVMFVLSRLGEVFK